MNSNRALISIRDAALAYLGAWLVGNLAAGAVLAASGADSVAEAGPGWLAGVSLAQRRLGHVLARFGVGEQLDVDPVQRARFGLAQAIE